MREFSQQLSRLKGVSCAQQVCCYVSHGLKLQEVDDLSFVLKESRGRKLKLTRSDGGLAQEL